jgi:hypothetical protein
MNDKTQPDPIPLERPQQIESLAPDQMVAVILRLTMEISTLRERLATHEQLLQQAGVFSDAAIDDFQVDAEDKSRRQAERQRLIEGVVSDLR